ncbi:MAG: ABC transporter permease [Haloarculaceae archaeon]
MLTLWVAVTLAFVLIRLIPGGPITVIRAQLRQQYPTASREMIQRGIQTYIGITPDEPMWEQYVDYITGVLLHFDFGRSITLGRPVADVYAEALPWTMFLIGSATFLMTIFSITIGALLAYEQQSKFDIIVSNLSITIGSIPYYLVAILLIALFVTYLGWLPASGARATLLEAGFSVAYIGSILKHAILPILSLSVAGAETVLGMRANSVRILGEDYLRVARLRMLPTHRIALRYVAHNAILPVYTGLVLSVVTLLAGSVILEQIFQYPGVGLYFFQSIGARDYPLMMGGFLMISAATVVAIFVADMTYSWIDPRASAGGAASESY